MSMLIQTTFLKEMKKTKKQDKHKPWNKTHVRDLQKKQSCFNLQWSLKP